MQENYFSKFSKESQLDYIGQVRRLVDALIVCLVTIPDSVNVKDVQNSITVLIKACKSSNFVKIDDYQTDDLDSLEDNLETKTADFHENLHKKN